MSGIFSAFRIATSALTGQRLRMDIIANNVANAETTRTEEGGPYQRQTVVFQAEEGDHTLPVNVPGRVREPVRGLRVTEIIKDDSPGNRVHDPNHPDADEEGFVSYPNVNIVTEMTDMLSATRSYEANVTVFNALKNMALRALDIGRG